MSDEQPENTEQAEQAEQAPEAAEAAPQEEAKAEAGETKYDVLAIGSAIVDVLIKADDTFLESIGIKKGTMTMLDEAQAEKLFPYFEQLSNKDALESYKEMSGGCAANTVAGVSSFGGKAAFIGKISADPFGDRFKEKLQGRGVEFNTEASKDGKTARSLIIISEDGTRSMCTFLGTGSEVDAADINEDLVKDSKITFLTGFSWDSAKDKASAERAIELAKANNHQVAFTLADDHCVERHRDDFMKMTEEAQIIFANEEELSALFSVGNFADAIEMAEEHFAKKDTILALLRSEAGAVVVDKDGKHEISDGKVDAEQIVDRTGAGALFAGGFLYGQTHNFDLKQSAQLGNMAAAEGMKNFGARPASELKSLLAKI